MPGAAQAGADDLTVAATFGPTAEVPDPRAGYDAWRSNRIDVAEKRMGIDHDLSLVPRPAEGIGQARPTT